MILQAVLTIIRRWLWLIVLGAVVGALLSYGSALRARPIYETSAGVVVVRRGIEVNLDPRFVTTSGEGGLFDLKGNGLTTLASLVANEAIAEQVYGEFKGDFADLVTGPSDLTGMVSGDVKDGIIQIKVRSPDAQLATRLANLWATHYTDYINRIYAGKMVVNELAQQIEAAKTRYEEAQAALVEFMRSDEGPRLNSIIEEKQAILNRIILLRTDEVAGSLETAFEQRKQTEALLQNALNLQELLRTSNSLPSNAANSLALLYLQYGFINGNTLNKSGAVVSGSTDAASANNAPQTALIPVNQYGVFQFNFTPQRLEDIASTPEQLQNDLDQLIKALQNQLVAYDAEIERLTQIAASKASTETDPLIQSLFADIANLQAQVQAVDARRKELVEERDLLWEGYTLLKKGSEETNLTAAAASETLVRFAIPASVPRRPTKSSATQNAVLGAFAGLMLAIAFVFVYELFDDRVRDRSDVEQVLELPVLGMVARGVAEREQQPISAIQADAPLTEAMRTLRIAVANALEDRRSLLVTSWHQGEGKTTIVANLGLVIAQSGRSVLLIDGNLRAPRLHELFHIKNDRGLNQMLEEPEANIIDYIQTTAMSGLSILPAGAKSDLAPDLVASGRMDGILREAVQHAELVIIDSPAVGSVADALAISEKAGGALLVIQAKSTKVAEVQDLRERIEGAGGAIWGVVLNRVPGPSVLSTSMRRGIGVKTR